MPIDDDEEDKMNGEAQAGEAAPDDEAETLVWESAECPPEAKAQFWRSVAAYEQAPLMTHFQQLEEAGIRPPSPESMDDPQLEAKLWEVIEGLAGLRVFLSHTDHLNDRALYTLFWHGLLHEAVKDLPLDDSSAWHIDLTGSGSEEDTSLYLRSITPTTPHSSSGRRTSPMTGCLNTRGRPLTVTAVCRGRMTGCERTWKTIR